MYIYIYMYISKCFPSTTTYNNNKLKNWPSKVDPSNQKNTSSCWLGFRRIHGVPKSWGILKSPCLFQYKVSENGLMTSNDWMIWGYLEVLHPLFRKPPHDKQDSNMVEHVALGSHMPATKMFQMALSNIEAPQAGAWWCSSRNFWNSSKESLLPDSNFPYLN